MDLFQIPDDVPRKPLSDQQMDDIENYLKNHPLFMKELPENIEENEHLVALQHLKEEIDNDQEVQSLLNEGNDVIKKNPDNIHYQRKAFQKYTEAIEIKSSQTQTMAKLHCNRAFVNLKLKNYGKVFVDCKIALKYDPQYTKAYYRLAKAMMAVQKYREAIEALKKRQEKELIQLKVECEKEIAKIKAKSQSKKSKKDQIENQIEELCKQKAYKVIKRPDPLPENAKIELSEDCQSLSIPIVFAYPEFSQMDLIAKTSEEEKIKNYLGQLFENPLPWDHKREYNMESCELFFEISEERMMKVPKQAKICELAKRVVLRGALQISIVAKGNKFYSQFVKNKQII